MLQGFSCVSFFFKPPWSKVKHYIDEFLDPSKASSVDNLTVSEAPKFLNIAEVDSYDAISLSPTSDYQMHLRRSPNSSFINNYNAVMLQVWRANMNIQPFFNYYKAVSYMPAYFSKSIIGNFTNSNRSMQQNKINVPKC